MDAICLYWATCKNKEECSKWYTSIWFTIIPLSGYVVYYIVKSKWKFGIKRTPIKRDDGKTYMIRWTILDIGFMALKIHKIILSDLDCPRDHPWSFVTFIFKGHYQEEYVPSIYCKVFDLHNLVDYYDIFKCSEIKVHKSPKILYRNANHIHRLCVDKPCWTFVITFKKIREWGFVTIQGWTPWYNYNSKNKC